MICTDCETTIPDDSVYCYSCGMWIKTETDIKFSETVPGFLRRYCDNGRNHAKYEHIFNFCPGCGHDHAMSEIPWKKDRTGMIRFVFKHRRAFGCESPDGELCECRACRIIEGSYNEIHEKAADVVGQLMGCLTKSSPNREIYDNIMADIKDKIRRTK